MATLQELAAIAVDPRWINEKEFRSTCRVCGKEVVTKLLLGTVYDTCPTPSCGLGAIAKHLVNKPNGEIHTTNGGAAADKPRHVGPPSKLAYALAYARHGIPVFPVHCIDPDGECSCGKIGCSSAGKHPVDKGWQQAATTDLNAVRAAWHRMPNANVGVACGKTANLTVLDVDGDEGRETLRTLELENGELPETPLAITGSGGNHYYFRYVEGVGNAVRFARDVGTGLDIRTEGGLVVGVGSKTKAPYVWEATSPPLQQIAVMPDWLVAKIKATQGGTNGKAITVSERPLAEGEGRNNELYRVGRSNKARGFSQEAHKTSLVALNKSYKQPLDDAELREIIQHTWTQGDRADFAAKLPVTTNANGQVPAVIELPVETFEGAVEANRRYLERQPVIEGLYYSAAASMITGGKHSGKSTLARWQAICVVKGHEFLGRSVQQGPVIYLASEDEEMVARSELMKLGWNASDPLFFIGKSQIPEDLDEAAILKLLTQEIVKRSAVLVVVDMLFDFIPVRDEMGYAETRAAVGLLQHVASETSTHITVLHHAPKHASLSADAAITALGSQGLAARVSPIVLTRRYGPGVHAVISTSVRDPRGNPLPDSRLLLHPDGSMAMGGSFSAYMLAEVYADRVLELVGGEPGQEFTVNDVMEKLDIPYPPARATLKHLCEHGLINRSGDGKKRSPFRYSVPLTEISFANEKQPDQNSVQVGGTYRKQSTTEPADQAAIEYKKNFTPPGDDADPNAEGYGLPDKYGIAKGD